MSTLTLGRMGTERREGPIPRGVESLGGTGTRRMNSRTFMYSFNKHIPSTSYVPDAVLGMGEIVMNTTGVGLALTNVHSSKRRQYDENQTGSEYREG